MKKFTSKMAILVVLVLMIGTRATGCSKVADETFVREAQKGSKKLESYIGKGEEPRYGRKPSKYGVMGAEFATITTAIDNTGHCV